MEEISTGRCLLRSSSGIQFPRSKQIYIVVVQDTLINYIFADTMKRSSLALLVGFVMVLSVQSVRVHSNHQSNTEHHLKKGSAHAHPYDWDVDGLEEDLSRHRGRRSYEGWHNIPDHPDDFVGWERRPFGLNKRSSWDKWSAVSAKEAAPITEQTPVEEAKKETIIHPIPVSKRAVELKQTISKWQPVRTEPHIEGKTASTLSVATKEKAASAEEATKSTVTANVASKKTLAAPSVEVAVELPTP